MEDTLLALLQWPAMIATLASAWLVASQSKQKRVLGFLIFIFSNFLWILWGWHDGAYALIVMQLGLLFLNIRGAIKNESKKNERVA